MALFDRSWDLHCISALSIDSPISNIKLKNTELRAEGAGETAHRLRPLVSISEDPIQILFRQLITAAPED